MGAINNFVKAEVRERKALEWFLKHKGSEVDVIDISSVGSYQYTDFIITSGKTFVIGEIKIRDFEYDKYPTAYIELDKISRMFEKGSEYHNTGSLKLLYFAFYPKSRKLLIFDVSKPSNIIYKSAPVSTMDMSRGYTLKTFVEFDINQAIEIINY